MAVSSSSTSTSSAGTASIDVASIVAQLMTVENKPLDALTAKISQQQVVISDLGTIKSKVSAFGEVLKAFQNPTSYNSAVASTTNSTVLQANAANGAIPGNYSITVGATAAASKYTISGYSSMTDLAGVDSGVGFSITVGSTTYNTLGTPAGTPSLASSATIGDLRNWINGLGVNVNASLVQTTDSSHYALMIQGTQTGVANALSYSGLNIVDGPSIVISPGSAVIPTATESASTTFNALTAGQTLVIGGLTFTAGTSGATADQVAAAFASVENGATYTSINASKGLGNASGGTFTAGSLSSWSSGSATGANVVFTSATSNANVENLASSGSAGGLLATTVSTAQDAAFTVNGTSFTRSSNAVSDVIDGVTLNLVSSSIETQVLNIARGADNSKKTITDLIASYNDLVNTYKTMTANSSNSTAGKLGTFANSPTVLAFIGDIKSKLSSGATYGSPDPVTGKLSTISLSAMGMDLQLDGTIKFNDAAYALASNKGLQGILSSGVRIGGITGTLSSNPKVTTTQGTASSTESASVSFSSMSPNETLSFAGLTFKAGSSGASAAQVASAFASLSPVGTTAASFNSSKSLSALTGGTFTSGTLAGWSSAGAVGTSVVFSSATSNADVADLTSTQTAGATDLLAFINSQVGTNGVLSMEIQAKTTESTNLNKRQANLQTRLLTIQNSLTAQYSALNALLYQLSSTSTALSSALTALTNSQSKN